MQTELTKGQQETFDSLLKYQDGTAERYRDFCFTSRGTKPRSKPRTLDHELVDQRTCSLCGTVFFKRQRESNRHFLARPGCSRLCSVRINKLDRRAIASKSTNPHPKTSPSPRSPMPKVKQCATCDRNFYRGVGELAHNWRIRKVCSKECRSELKSKSATLARREKVFNLSDEQLKMFDDLAIEYGVDVAKRYRQICLNPPVIRPRGDRQSAPDSKICDRCGNVFRKNAHESFYNWNIRKTCGRKCPKIGFAEPKNCEICDRLFSRRDNESVHNFLNRRACCKDCKYVLRAKK